MIVLTMLFCGIEFHVVGAFDQAIAGAVPQIVELLKDKDMDVKFAGERTMERLFDHGK